MKRPAMRVGAWLSLIVMVNSLSSCVTSFTPSRRLSFKSHNTRTSVLKPSSRVGATAANQQDRRPTSNTLTPSTTWKLRFVIRGAPTQQGKKVDPLMFNWNVQFVEDEGYEPPQGTLVQLKTTQDESTDTSAPKMVASRWKLSEDPNERRDSFWVWGLFEEPLYPFLLLEIQTDQWNPPDSEDVVLPLRLFAQVKHRRDKESGVLLENSELIFRQVETVKADPFGAATVDLFQEVSMGQVSFLPF